MSCGLITKSTKRFASLRIDRSRFRIFLLMRISTESDVLESLLTVPVAEHIANL